MAKKHIVTVGYRDFATDSAAAAADLVKLMARFKPCKFHYQSGGAAYYEPDNDPRNEIKLELNQPWKEPQPEKPVKAAKPLALPKPARGTIRCICDKSDVSPRTSCAHCGRPFSESHNRTHGADQSGKTHLRLL
jgi:hypothetical protein